MKKMLVVLLLVVLCSVLLAVDVGVYWENNDFCIVLEEEDIVIVFELIAENSAWYAEYVGQMERTFMGLWQRKSIENVQYLACTNKQGEDFISLFDTFIVVNGETYGITSYHQDTWPER